MSKILVLTAVAAFGLCHCVAKADCGCQQAPDVAGPCAGASCEDTGNGCGCPLCALETLGRRCGAKKAAVGYFNCQCRGSYKFPVPPQYTYHWPGMYSQQTMTEYASPFRFPPLKLPEDVFGTGADEKVKGAELNDLESGARDAPKGTTWKTTFRRSAEPGRLPGADGASRVLGAEPPPSQIIKSRLGVRQ